MKNILLLTLIVSLLASCSNTPDDGYAILGKISGKVPAKVYLQQYTDGEMMVLDSANFVNGEFKLRGKLIEPDFYYLRIGNEKNLLGLFLENSKILVTAHVDSISKGIIEGSSIQNQYNDYKDSQALYKQELKEIYKDYKNAETTEIKDAAEAKYDSVDNIAREAALQYIETINTSILAPYILRRELIYYMDLSQLEDITNKLSPELKDNKYAKQLYEHIATLRSLQPGMPAPLFTQNDTVGNPINLADFKGNYLLIDFWASWCGPCRRANPTVVEVFNKYSPKNFTILGVSMDDDKEKWMKAIADDGLTWTQVSTLEGWGNPLAKMYGVNSIPHAILIDPEGNIVERGIHAGDLDELLASLIQ